MSDHELVVGNAGWASDYRSGFSPHSHFRQSEGSRAEPKSSPQLPYPPAPPRPPRALFASTTSGFQGDVVEIKSGQIRAWYHDVDDALASIEDGNARGLEDAVRGLSTLRDILDDVVRSAHGSSRSHRTAG